MSSDTYLTKSGLGHHYLQYEGNVMIRTWCGPRLTKATGRVMVDGSSFNRFYPNYSEFRLEDEEEQPLETVPDDLLWLTWATLPGFSFAVKKWGEIFVDQLSEIQFDDRAYDRLVLPAKKKQLIKALVLQHTKRFQPISDFITGKGITVGVNLLANNNNRRRLHISAPWFSRCRQDAYS